MSVLERIDEALTYYSAGLGAELDAQPEEHRPVGLLVEAMALVGSAPNRWQTAILQRAFDGVLITSDLLGHDLLAEVFAEADRISARLSRMHSAYPRRWRRRR